MDDTALVTLATIRARTDVHLLLVEHRAGSVAGTLGQIEVLCLTAGTSLETMERILQSALAAVTERRTKENA